MFLIANSPTRSLLCAIPVGKFSIGTPSTNTDTASAASGKE